MERGAVDFDTQLEQEDLLGRMSVLGVKSEEEIPLYMPFRYDDYTAPVKNLRTAIGADTIYTRLKVATTPTIDHKAKPKRVSLAAVDGAGNRINITVFGKWFPWRGVNKGDVVHLTGTVEQRNGFLQLKGADIVPHLERGRINARYPGKPEVIGTSAITEKVRVALLAHLDDTVEYMCDTLGQSEAQILKNAHLDYPSLSDLLKTIHRPESLAQAEQALTDARRLGAYQVYCTSVSQRNRQAVKQSSFRVNRVLLDKLTQQLPFTLTDDQSAAVRDAIKDLAAPHPMRRLISGDVGVGKTLCYLLPAAAAQALGKKVAILIPSQLVATQVAGEFARFFPDQPVTLVSGGRGKKLNLDDNPVLIGTTALIHSLTKHHPDYRADLLINDEQQKLSRDQREALMGAHTNLLEATATAIPRTAALIAHGAMDVSIVAQCPVQKNITSRVVSTADRDKRLHVFNRVRDIVAQGGQVAIIHPLVNETADPEKDKRNVENAAIAWERYFPGRIGVLHGKLKAAEKTAVIEAMKAGQYDILVSSSVIEIGVTLPDLKGLVVVDAERYGASTLHQMRGRVARMGGDGDFYMLVSQPFDQMNEKSLRRLKLLVKYKSGFEISEHDMEQRGFGDLAQDSSRQTGKAETLLYGISVSQKDVRFFLNQKKTAQSSELSPTP